MKRKIKIVFAYEGTAYCGLQIQKNGPSVQAEMEKALAKILKEQVKLIASGRTDSGVHARGQVAHIVTHTRMPAERIAYAMNTILPKDIIVWSSEEASLDFHARYNVKEKTYRYRILNQPFHDPFLRNWSWHIKRRLDVEKMKQAASYIVGTHDFTSFCSIRTRIENRVRTLHEVSIDVTPRDTSVPGQGHDIWITCRGNGFLYNMVRVITGTLVEVGLGKWSVEDVQGMLAGQDRNIAGITAPSQGLYLWDVCYESQMPTRPGV